MNTDHPLHAALRGVRDLLRRYKGRALGEQNTKASLIEPVLEALGWDVRDPEVVHREFKPTSKDSPVDYAMLVNRNPRLFVEAKGLGEDLADRRWIGQILGYATMAGVEWCVLTDGDQWRFYNAGVVEDADGKLFWSVRLSESEPAEAARVLGLLSHRHLEERLIDAAWNAHYVDRRVSAALRAMLDGADGDVVRWLRRRASGLGTKAVAESLRRLTVRIEAPSLVAGPLPAAAARGGLVTRMDRARVGDGGRRTSGLAELIAAGVLPAPLVLMSRYKKHDLRATAHPDGTIEFGGRRFATPSAAGAAAKASAGARSVSTDGWTFWSYEDGRGKRIRLTEARARFLRAGERPR